jgi:hypothetical protein
MGKPSSSDDNVSDLNDGCAFACIFCDRKRYLVYAQLCIARRYQCIGRNYVARTPADQYYCHLFSTFHEHASRGPKLLVIQENGLNMVQFEKLGSEEFRWSELGTVACLRASTAR